MFNLGKVNTVNRTTTLSGSTPSGAQLRVTNTSAMGAATGLRITTASSQPALIVSNNVLNPKLNAEFVGGLAASSLGRVGMASDENFSGGFPFAPLVTVSITAPRKGFVRLEGRVGAFDGRAASFCGDCEVGVRIRDVSAGTTSPQSIAIGGESTRSSYLEIPTTWVFPVSAAGVYSYALDAGQVAFSGGPFALENPVLVAQFVPFGSTGSASTLGARSRVAAHPGRLGTR